ncbi:hypothetical protein B0H16DRAFT_1889245 [Mycena metata]|uniref:Uncharacterized protein n=1 Tax=Mycena metata TaxID=1033252 RepID=A0AAD7ILN9_9AGAR|nr:hypothetical protein B0H16DRAFT_1889245 [Mycena metata]
MPPPPPPRSRNITPSGYWVFAYPPSLKVAVVAVLVEDKAEEEGGGGVLPRGYCPYGDACMLVLCGRGRGGDLRAYFGEYCTAVGGGGGTSDGIVPIALRRARHSRTTASAPAVLPAPCARSPSSRSPFSRSRSSPSCSRSRSRSRSAYGVNVLVGLVPIVLCPLVLDIANNGDVAEEDGSAPLTPLEFEGNITPNRCVPTTSLLPLPSNDDLRVGAAERAALVGANASCAMDSRALRGYLRSRSDTQAVPRPTLSTMGSCWWMSTMPRRVRAVVVVEYELPFTFLDDVESGDENQTKKHGITSVAGVRVTRVPAAAASDTCGTAPSPCTGLLLPFLPLPLALLPAPTADLVREPYSYSAWECALHEAKLKPPARRPPSPSSPPLHRAPATPPQTNAHPLPLLPPLLPLLPFPPLLSPPLPLSGWWRTPLRYRMGDCGAAVHR